MYTVADVSHFNAMENFRFLMVTKLVVFLF